MKKIICLAIVFVLLGVVIGLYANELYHVTHPDARTAEVLERQRARTQDAYLNLNYEIIAHEQDVGLLKKELQTIRLQCEGIGVP